MDDCNPSNPMPVFEIHGTNDNVTYYEGDPNNDDNWGAYPDLPSTIDFFIELNGLDQITTEELPNIDTGDGSTVTAQIATSDSSPNEVWFYTVNGGGHDWPGAFGNMDINSSEEIWAFFEKMCENATSIDINESSDQSRELVKIVDLLGRETIEVPNTLLIYMYSDGTSEKKVIRE
jgi:polyhydroxybutyrate depolymerase